MRTPYDFQRDAIFKLSPRTSRLIADEMGTGKTAQGIWLDIKDRQQWVQNHGPTVMKTLIVAPLAVHDNWEEHLQDLAPGVTIIRIDPKNRATFVKALSMRISGYYIVHWQALRLIVDDLKKVQWFHIIADEVHRAKNRKAQQTQALKQLKAYKKTGLSGTPADDRPDDFWSVANWLYPTYYRSYWKFRKHYCVEEQIDLPPDKIPPSGKLPTRITGVKNVESFHKEIDPWYIRRLKEEVLEDLPDKYYSTVWVDLDPKQRRAYEQMRRDMITWLEHQDQTVPLVAPVVIAQLTRLQQFALGYMQPHPDKPGKWIMTDPSTKLDFLCELIEDNPTEQLVVFSQSKAILYLLSSRLDRMRVSHGLYTGDAKQVDKDRMVHSFQAGNTQVFAGTIAAGGEGITLTSSSTVLFLDRAWSPTRNIQAEDRLHRIGQKNAVQVIDIMARRTVDLDRKRKIDLKWETLRELLGDKR